MRIQIPLTPDLDNETYLQITIKDDKVNVEKLIVDHVNKMRTSEDIFEESNSGDIRIGPWFRLIKENFLNSIWRNLNSLDKIKDSKVHDMGEVK